MLPIGPLIPGLFLGRPNRFVALVEVAGQAVRVHVPTSSRAHELLLPGARVLLAPCPGAHRVTAYDLVMTYHGDTLVSVDSRVPNRLLDGELRAGAVPEFAGWTYQRAEVVLGESRLDFLLQRGEARCWIEAKSVTLVVDGVALFPDAPTARGARHLRELAAARARGDRAAAVFIIQRDDARRFAPNRACDPDFAVALDAAAVAGVEIVARTCRVTPDGMALGERVEVLNLY